MKSFKLLAALAVPAMFAACTSEELVSVESPQKMNEVVGGEVIGTDVSMSIANLGGVQTRYAGGVYGWDTEDRLGLGWICVGGGPSTDQAAGTLGSGTAGSKLYANHLYEVVGSGFATKGNLYKGWHFAYYPYGYEETVTEKKFEINPALTLDLLNDEDNVNWYKRSSERLHVSALQFLTKESLTEDYQLKDEIKLTPETPLASIVIGATVVDGCNFATNSNLKEYSIDTITLNVGADVFAPYAKLEACKLHQYDKEIEVAEGGSVEDANKAALINSFKDAFVAYKDAEYKTAGRVSSMTTDITAAGYTVSGGAGILSFALPMVEKTTLAVENVSITLAAGGGKFVITHTGQAEEEGSWKAVNNKAIEDLVAAYGENGVLLTNGQLQLSLMLHEDIFVAVWDGIMTDEDWNKKFKLATDLGIANPTFTLASGATVEFKSTTLTPANKEGLADVVKSVTVHGEKTDGDYDSQIIITEDMTWDNNIFIPKEYTDEEGNTVNNKAVGVVIDKKDVTLSVEGTEAEPYDFKPFRIKNKGTIKVNGWASVGLKGYNNLDNSEGRIEIQYGAYVYPATNKAEGVIAYRVTDVDTKSPDNIRILTSKEWSKGWANVNTLIIDKDINLDLSKKADKPNNTEGDRYQNATNGTIEGEEYPSLANINIEINEGGTFSKATGEVASVNNVTVNGGSVAGAEGALTNIAILGKLTINNGTVNVHTVNSIEIQGGVNDITTAHSISGGLIANGENTIKVSGTVIGDVILNGDDYVEVDAIKGHVTITGENNTLICGKVMGSVTVNGTANLNDVATIEGDLNVAENANLTVNSEENVSVANIKNDGKMTVNADVTVKNITLTEPSETYVQSGFAILYSGEFVNDGLRKGQINKNENAVEEDEPVLITTLAEFQAALDAAAEGTTVIALGADIEGDATVTQKPNVKITIEGNNNDYKGLIIVDGKAARYETAGLTIQNVNFNAESISADAYINLGDGTDATRYTNNVTVKDCTFSGSGLVAIKSYTGGDKNLNVSGCTVNAGMHSLLQVTNVEEGLKVEDCWVYSKNGINLNSTPALEMNNCTFDVKGYAVRVGVNGSVNTEIKNFSIANSTLKSACEESDDAVIIFRDNATKSKLTLTNTVLSGTREFLGNTTDTQIVK